MKIVKVDLMAGDKPIDVIVEDADADDFLEFIKDASEAILIVEQD
jgi:hypothetical protein